MADDTNVTPDPVVVKFAGNRMRPRPDMMAKSQAQDLLERQAEALRLVLAARETVARVLKTLHDRRPGAAHEASAVARAPQTETSFFPALEALTKQFEEAAKALADDAADIESLF